MHHKIFPLSTVGNLARRVSLCRTFAVLSLIVALCNLVSQAEGRKITHRQSSDTGASLYMASCEPCHQTGGNMIDSAKKIVGSDKITSQARFKKFLAGQHAQMPPWKTIIRNDSELKALYAYVRRLK
jgi:mono/diheme cytochrome c family protein